ncbi:YdcF family protein [Psychrobacter sp. FDAARGOS_221]|nr:YdcF family protein [Psychrobacter sp. FDAARGOS_221]
MPKVTALSTSKASEAFSRRSDQHKLEKYQNLLENSSGHPLSSALDDPSDIKAANSAKPNDINQIAPAATANHYILHKPTAYVVLGGGLTEASSDDEKQAAAPDTDTNTNTQDDKPTNTPLSANNIVLNDYSLNRMKTVVAHYKIHPLPIIVTGVEAPWMRDWLTSYGIENVITENASMNTCENARFTAKRLKLSNVYLVTDAYHMTRTRRQFALNNIQTSPIVAPLPMQKSWSRPKDNAQHSRRTIYELAAYTRDIFAPQQNCRQADDVSFATLLHSRKPEAVKTF